MAGPESAALPRPKSIWDDLAGSGEAEARIGLSLLNAELDRAMQFARRADCDLPSNLALDRVRWLLALLAIQCPGAAQTTEASISEDGTIELTTTHMGHRYTTEVSSTSGRVEMVAQDEETGDVLAESFVGTEMEAVSRIVRGV